MNTATKSTPDGAPYIGSFVDGDGSEWKIEIDRTAAKCSVRYDDGTLTTERSFVAGRNLPMDLPVNLPVYAWLSACTWAALSTTSPPPESVVAEVPPAFRQSVMQVWGGWGG